MRPGAPRLAELLSCRLLLVLIVCCPGIPANQQGTKKTLAIGYLPAMTVSRLLVVVREHNQSFHLLSLSCTDTPDLRNLKKKIK